MCLSSRSERKHNVIRSCSRHAVSPQLPHLGLSGRGKECKDHFSGCAVHAGASVRHAGWPAICALFSVCRGQTCGQQPKSGEAAPRIMPNSLLPLTTGNGGEAIVHLPIGNWLHGFRVSFLPSTFLGLGRSISFLPGPLRSSSLLAGIPLVISSPRRLHNPTSSSGRGSATALFRPVSCHLPPLPRSSLCYDVLFSSYTPSLVQTNHPRPPDLHSATAIRPPPSTPFPPRPPRRRGWCETTATQLPEGSLGPRPRPARRGTGWSRTLGRCTLQTNAAKGLLHSSHDTDCR
jgi:hypothetical protein